MKKILFIGLAVLVSAALMVSITPTFAAEPFVVWKVYTPFLEHTLPHKAAQTWAGDVSRMSGGRMKIDLIAPIGAAEPPVDIFSAVQKGIGDAGYTSPAFMIGKYPAAMLFAGTPAFLDLLGYFTWMHAYGGKELLQEIHGKALKIFPACMTWAKTGAWANRKFETFSDFKGRKYGNAGPVFGKILTEAGASVEMVGWEAVLRFQRETLDAAEFSTPWLDMMIGLHKFTKYCYFPGIQQIAGFFEILVNNERWDTLPSDLKEIVKGACDAAMVRSLADWALDDAKAVNVLQSEGKISIIKYSKEMQQELLDNFVAKYDAVPDPMFQKVWKSQKEFMKIYVPYMKLQQVDAEVKLK